MSTIPWLEEMKWLAGDFVRERKFRMKLAKKAAYAVARSNLDLESRVVKRAADEYLHQRKTARWVINEVMHFWMKAGCLKAGLQCIARSSECGCGLLIQHNNRRCAPALSSSYAGFVHTHAFLFSLNETVLLLRTTSRSTMN
jgi:hypothetical protein